MTDGTMIELGPRATARLEALARQYGEDSAASMISRAMGFMDAVGSYMRNGVVTVVDPDAPPDDPDGGRVEFLFENARPRQRRTSPA